MKDTYLTISSPSQGLYKEKASKFLSFAFPVQNEHVIAQYLEELHEKYYDARHHCYAWRLGPEGKKYRANDAGEPNHTAGDPILNELKSRQLFDVLVVVVRYFGGTKLGIPGLINAYGLAAADALHNATFQETTLTEPVHIQFQYGQTAEVGRILQKFNLKPTHSEYGADCRQSFDVRLRDREAVVEVFKEMGIFTDQ